MTASATIRSGARGDGRASNSGVALLLILYGVFMMRWNVAVGGGQNLSLFFAGFMHYQLPLLPHDAGTFKEGLLGAMAVAVTPFILFRLINKIVPCLNSAEDR